MSYRETDTQKIHKHTHTHYHNLKKKKHLENMIAKIKIQPF